MKHCNPVSTQLLCKLLSFELKHLFRAHCCKYIHSNAINTFISRANWLDQQNTALNPYCPIEGKTLSNSQLDGRYSLGTECNALQGTLIYLFLFLSKRNENNLQRSTLLYIGRGYTILLTICAPRVARNVCPSPTHMQGSHNATR